MFAAFSDLSVFRLLCLWVGFDTFLTGVFLVVKVFFLSPQCLSVGGRTVASLPTVSLACPHQSHQLTTDITPFLVRLFFTCFQLFMLFSLNEPLSVLSFAHLFISFKMSWQLYVNPPLVSATLEFQTSGP